MKVRTIAANAQSGAPRPLQLLDAYIASRPAHRRQRQSRNEKARREPEPDPSGTPIRPARVNYIFRRPEKPECQPSSTRKLRNRDWRAGARSYSFVSTTGREKRNATSQAKSNSRQATKELNRAKATHGQAKSLPPVVFTCPVAA